MPSKRQMYEYIIQYAREHGLDASGIPKPDTRKDDVPVNMPYDLYGTYVVDGTGNRRLIRRSVIKDMYEQLPKIHIELEILLYKVEAIFQSDDWRHVDKQDRTRLVDRLNHILDVAQASF